MGMLRCFVDRLRNCSNRFHNHTIEGETMKFLHTLLVYLMLGSFIIATLLGIIEVYAVHRELETVSKKTVKAILITLGCMVIWSLLLSYI